MLVVVVLIGTVFCFGRGAMLLFVVGWFCWCYGYSPWRCFTWLWFLFLLLLLLLLLLLVVVVVVVVPILFSLAVLFEEGC